MKKIKNSFKFEVSFDLNIYKGETLQKGSIEEFRRQLKEFVFEYAGDRGYFYVYGKDYDVETIPKNIKVKQIKL
jgi:hypothetical protein